MADFYIYLDYGSGWTLVTPNDNKLELTLRRGVLNDFIQRKALKNSFKLVDTEFDTANTYFITGSNYKAPIRVYQNGLLGVGTLKFEGWARVKGLWDYRRKIVTLDSFETDDQYTTFQPLLDIKYEGETLLATGSTGVAFVSQGQATNANKAHAINFDGTNFSFLPTTSIPNVGYTSTTYISPEIHVFNPTSGMLKGYGLVGTTWTEVRSRTINLDYEMRAIVAVVPNILVMSEGDGFLLEYTPDGGTSYTLINSGVFSVDVKYPELQEVNSTVVLVDELSTALRVLSWDSNKGYTSKNLEIGAQVRPSLAYIGANNFALIDASKTTLQTYAYNGSAFSLVGESLKITSVEAPKITTSPTANRVFLHCAIRGTLRAYDFDGTNWAQVGNSSSLQGGYNSSINWSTTQGMVISSDAFVFRGSAMFSYIKLINGILFQLGIDVPPHSYTLPTSGNGSTMDINKLVFADMRDIADNVKDDGDQNYYKFSLKELLKWYELFQDYWYIDSNNNIKFTQPDLFSSAPFGDTISISGLDLVDQLEQVLYKEEFSITKEEILFNNAINPDFEDNYIIYPDRDSPITETTKYPFTTDLKYLVDSIVGSLGIKSPDKSGLLLYYLDSTNPNITPSGTGIKSTIDTRNYLLSQSQIYNDFLKDYRYKNTGNYDMNGISTPVQNTARNIIEYPEVLVTNDMIGITEFPDSVGNLNWGGGKESLIMEFSQALSSGIITIQSRLHDL